MSYRKHGRKGRHIPLGLGGGGTVSLQERQVAAAETALFHDATDAPAAAARPAGWPACKSHRGGLVSTAHHIRWGMQGAPERTSGEVGGSVQDRPSGPGHPLGTANRHSLGVPRSREVWKMGTGAAQQGVQPPGSGATGSCPEGHAGTPVPPWTEQGPAAPRPETLRQVGMGGGRRRREGRSEDLQKTTPSSPPVLPLPPPAPGLSRRGERPGLPLG